MPNIPTKQQERTEHMNAKQQLNLATRRTVVNGVWATVIAVILAWIASAVTGQPIDTAHPLIVLAAPILYGVFYRGSREVADRWPRVGRVLFGSSESPVYDG